MDETRSDDVLPPREILAVSVEQAQALARLCTIHEKGLTSQNAKLRYRRAIPFLAFSLAACIGLIVFANLIPPFIPNILFGIVVGMLYSATREQRRLEGVWPLYERIIDWQLASQLLKKTRTAESS